MQSTATKLERRVTILERDLRKLRSELMAVRNVSKQPWWKRVACSLKNEPLFDKITEAGRAYRRSRTPRAR